MHYHVSFPKCSDDIEFLDERDDNNIFTPYWSRSGKIINHKYWELESYYHNYFWFEFTFDLQFTGKDHAGIDFVIGILGYYFCFNLYDHRHWNSDTNNWEIEP